MERFNLEAAKNGAPVCTRDGKEARIICFDRDSEKRIVALIRNDDCLGYEYVETYTNNGRLNYHYEDDDDLMMRTSDEDITKYPHEDSDD